MNIDPVWLVPRLVERVWGRSDVGAWYGGAARADAAVVGEAWLTDAGCGTEGGGTFGALVEQDRAGMLGDTSGAPILIKMLFTAAALSVQVHPTDAVARATGVAASGKNEAWHILEAAPDAAVFVGFAAPVTPGELRAASVDGSVEGLLRRHAVHAGDTVPVSAGTVHAIGPGLVLLEVQDPVDVTYRLYDYGRPRPLQLEQALEVATLDAAGEIEPGPIDTIPGGQLLVRAPRFVLERRTVGDGLAVQPDGARYHLIVPLTAGVLLDGRTLQRGTAAFVPAQGRAARIGGDADAALAVAHTGPGFSPCLAAA